VVGFGNSPLVPAIAAALAIIPMALVAENANLCAGMKLTLEPTVVNGAAFAHWVDAISDIVENSITDGELTDTPTAHRLAWNLCAGTVGAANASATLREDIDLATCLEGVVTAQLRNAFTPA